MALGSGAWEGPFTFKSRFEEGQGTNPEELIGAALAGCFTMQVSHALAEAGNTARLGRDSGARCRSATSTATRRSRRSTS